MYLGKIMELTSSDELYAHPLHPYTQGPHLGRAIPDPEADLARERILLEGEVPSRSILRWVVTSAPAAAMRMSGAGRRSRPFWMWAAAILWPATV